MKLCDKVTTDMCTYKTLQILSKVSHNFVSTSTFNQLYFSKQGALPVYRSAISRPCSKTQWSKSSDHGVLCC